MARVPPEPLALLCNAQLAIADGYGDNEARMICRLPEGHEGLHQETYRSNESGQVTVTWERDDMSLRIEEAVETLEEAIRRSFPEAQYDFEFPDEDGSEHFRTFYRFFVARTPKSKRDRVGSFCVNAPDSITVVAHGKTQTVSLNQAIILMRQALRVIR